MSSPNLLSLPAEIHLKVGSFLTEHDLVPFSLASKRLHAVIFCQPQHKWTTDSFWKMMATDDSELQQQLLVQWDIRLKYLPRLRDWTKQVAGINRDSSWRVCNGCACYRVDKQGWEEGHELWYMTGLQEETTIDRLPREYRTILQRRVRKGAFCRVCRGKWENIGSSWDVGVLAS